MGASDMAWPNAIGIDHADFTDQSQHKMSKPVLVLVHDAFQTSGHFDSLTVELVKAGWRVLTPQLPSSTFVYQVHSFEADISSVVDCAKPVMFNGNDLVIVTHGYGAIPGSIAAEQLNIASLDGPRSGMVTKLVFIGGIVTQSEESYSDLVSCEHHAIKEGLIAAENPLQTLFNDCSTEAGDEAISKLRKQVAECLHTKVQSPGWTRIPCLYIVCEFDPLFRQASQDACVAKMRELNGNVSVERVLAGHAPHISKPREIAEILMRLSE